MKARPQGKELPRPLRSSSKVVVKAASASPQAPEKRPAPDNSSQDLSVLKKSVETTVSSPLDVVKIFENGTDEIIELLKSECFVIFECKVCRNLFRSVANFLTHKRSYCVDKFTSSDNNQNTKDILEHALLVGCNKGNGTSTRKTSRRDILSLLDSFVKKNKDSLPQSLLPFVDLSASTPSAIYNNCSPPKEPANDVAIVGSEGQVIGTTKEDSVDRLRCRTCDQVFGSVDRLSEHSKTCQANSLVVKRTTFGCPCCSKFFTTAWGVYRHLRRVHGKSSEQVRKLKMSVLKRESKPVYLCKSRQPTQVQEMDSFQANKMWMEEYENNGGDINKCFVCGRQFERRVALVSHTIACQKRKTNMVNDLKRRPPSPRLEGEKKSRIEVRMFYDKAGKTEGNSESSSVASSNLVKTSFPSGSNSTEETTAKGGKLNVGGGGSRSSSDEGVDSPTIPCSPEQLEAAPTENGFGSPDLSEEEADEGSNLNGSRGSDVEMEAKDKVVMNGHLTGEENGNETGDEMNDEAPESESETSSLEQEIDSKFDSTEDISSDVKEDPLEITAEDRLIMSESDMDPDKTPKVAIAKQKPESPEEELPEDLFPPIYMYISREENSCLICGKSFPKLSLAIKDVALHLGIARYRCAINSCSFKCFAKVDIQKHILLYHKIKKCNLFILNIPKEDMFTDNNDDDSADFLGFEASDPQASPPLVYKQYLEEVTDRVSPPYLNNSNCSPGSPFVKAFSQVL